MAFSVEEIPDLKGFTIEWAEPGNYLLSRRNVIYRTSSLKQPFERLATIDASALRTAAARLRLGQRLLRFQVTNLMPLANGDLFVTFDKDVGVISDGGYRRLGGLERPCRVLRSACGVDGAGSVYFGEYLANNERGPIRVYKYVPGDNDVTVVHTFPAGSIKHVHGVYFDALTDSLFCLTGDDDTECQILRTDDGFASLETVGSGDETWRAVSAVFTDDAIYYGMDAEYRANQIFRLDRKAGGRLELGEVSGTVFYSKRSTDGMFFTTTAENAPAQTENVAALWFVDKDDRLSEVVRYAKDRWHKTLFQFGTIHFPNGPMSDDLYFHLVGVVGDNRTFRVRRS